MTNIEKIRAGKSKDFDFFLHHVSRESLSSMINHDCDCCICPCKDFCDKPENRMLTCPEVVKDWLLSEERGINK